jgi:DNA-directed RNA polymerase specialized sigma24 family protein
MTDLEGDGARPELDAHPNAWWADSVKQLVWYAARKLQRRRWRGMLGGPVPGGNEAVDIVQAVCQKVLSGKRRWDPERHPDLLLYLKDQVDSEISNLVRSVDNTRVQRFPAVVDDDGNERPTDPPDGRPSPQDLALTQELESKAEEFALGFIDHLAGKTDLLDTVGAVLESDDDSKPADWAQRLHVPATEIYNRKKRLQRELKDYMDKRSLPSPRKGGTTRA